MAVGAKNAESGTTRRWKLSGCYARLDARGAHSEWIALPKHGLEVEPRERPRDAGVLAERVSAHLASVKTCWRAVDPARGRDWRDCDGCTVLKARGR